MAKKFRLQAGCAAQQRWPFPELEAALKEARLLADGTLAADGDVGLIEECLIDDGQEQCMRLEAAIVNLRKLVGSDFTGLNS